MPRRRRAARSTTVTAAESEHSSVPGKTRPKRLLISADESRSSFSTANDVYFTYPNNDRHHTFILQGARNAHSELCRLGVRALFHLDPTGPDESPLRKLAVRAAAVVVEDFPALPFPAWTRLLANRSPVSVLAVDCACIVPRLCFHTFDPEGLGVLPD